MTEPFTHAIEEPIYRFPITVVVGPLDDVRAWLKRRHPDADFPENEWRPAVAKILERSDEHGLQELWIWFPPKPFEAIDTCVHEAVHIGAKVLRQHNLRLNRHTEEAFAYYIEFVSRAMRQALATYASRKRKAR